MKTFGVPGTCCWLFIKYITCN